MSQGGLHCQDCDSPLYRSDEFRMFCFKVLPCSKRYCHDWTVCPFSHPGEKAKRRDPRVYTYTGIACTEMKKNLQCPRGDSCPYAHNVFEYWLHPSRYRTQLCNDGISCNRKVCFFAHTVEELRVPSCKALAAADLTVKGGKASFADLPDERSLQTAGLGLSPEPVGSMAADGHTADAVSLLPGDMFDSMRCQPAAHASTFGQLHPASLNVSQHTALLAQELARSLLHMDLNQSPEAMRQLASLVAQTSQNQYSNALGNLHLQQLSQAAQQQQQAMLAAQQHLARSQALAQQGMHGEMTPTSLAMLQRLQQCGNMAPRHNVSNDPSLQLSGDSFHQNLWQPQLPKQFMPSRPTSGYPYYQMNDITRDQEPSGAETNKMSSGIIHHGDEEGYGLFPSGLFDSVSSIDVEYNCL